METALEQTVKWLDERALPDDTEVRLTLAEARQAASATAICRDTPFRMSYEHWMALRAWQVTDFEAVIALELAHVDH